MQSNPATSLVRIRQIVGDPTADPPIPAIIPVSKSTWWSWVSRSIAPAPVRLSSGVTCWRLVEVLALADRAATDLATKHASTVEPDSIDGDAIWKQKLRARNGAP